MAVTRVYCSQSVTSKSKALASAGRFISKGEMILKKCRGGLGERGCEIAPGGTLADDGKRGYSDGRFISKGEMILKKWRGGLGERGCEIAPDGRLADIYG